MMATPESNKKTLETREKTKTGKGGLRGVPNQDKVNDKPLIIDPDGRKGHFKIDSNTIRVLDKAALEMKMGRSTLAREILHSFCQHYTEAKELKTSRSSLMRRVLEAFCLYQNDAQALKKAGMFDKQPTVESWLTERNLVREMSQAVQQKSQQLLRVKTSDDKLQIVAEQNRLLADMINILHKTTKT